MTSKCESVVIACLWRFARRTKKKERLLVVYSLIYDMCFSKVQEPK